MKIFSDYCEAQLRIRADADHETSPVLRALRRSLAQASEPRLKEGLERAIAALLVKQRGHR
jgi:uncharacterized protein (DUF2267 family)